MSDPRHISPDPILGRLQDLYLAVEALRPYLGTPQQQAELQLIDEALTRLANSRDNAPRLANYDPSLLAHLLEITGPDLAAELLARLNEDLTSTQDVLEEGARVADWKRLREGSHVLISLSGSVGALSLQDMSEDLNAIAHRQDRDALETLMPPLKSELAILIDLIRATRSPYGSLE